MADEKSIFDADAIDGTDGLGGGGKSVEVEDYLTLEWGGNIKSCNVFVLNPLSEASERGRLVEQVAVGGEAEAGEAVGEVALREGVAEWVAD